MIIVRSLAMQDPETKEQKKFMSKFQCNVYEGLLIQCVLDIHALFNCTTSTTYL